MKKIKIMDFYFVASLIGYYNNMKEATEDIENFKIKNNNKYYIVIYEYNKKQNKYIEIKRIYKERKIRKCTKELLLTSV